MTYRTILVPLDGSTLSEGALPTATALARKTGARLVLVKAAWPPAVVGPAPVEEQFGDVREAQLYLEDVAADLRAEGYTVKTAVHYTPVAQGILTEVEVSQADLVVMTTHGRSGLGRWIFGSVAEAVMAHSPVPVWLVRANLPHALDTLALERPRLIVPLDGSTFSEAILEPARELAHTLDATLVLLRVVMPTLPTADLAMPPLAPSDTVTAEEEDEAFAYLSEVAARYMEDGLRVQTTVRVGTPAEAILEESQVPGTGLVLMATHGRTGMARVLLGSVAMEVLRRGALPMLLARPVGARLAPTKEEAGLVPA